MTDLQPVVAALGELSDGLGALPLALELEGTSGARSVSTELQDQINDYLLPRLSRLDAPLLAVLGGSTGSGKSTITNTLAGSVVSPAGVLRPTTRAPTLICHPEDDEWFSAGEMLPGLPRVTGDGELTGHVLRITQVPTMQPGLAIIDAPDIDSVAEANRELATELLGAADLWLFTTTAVRYADAVPWEFLRRAQERGTSLALIINRVPPGVAEEIVPHLQEMVSDAGFVDIALFPIDEGNLEADGLLPQSEVADLRKLLEDLAASSEERARVIRQTVDGALASIPDRTRTILTAAEAEDQAAEDLRLVLEREYREAREALINALSSGTLLRDEVLDRWQELIGTNEIMRAVQSRISWVRDRVTSFVTGRTAHTEEVQGEITNTLEQLLVDLADDAALSVVSAWRQLPGGRQVVGTDRAMERASADFRNNVADEVRAWQDDILDLVRERGQGKRTTARILAFGVNSVGIALMIVIFAQTGGVTGGEVAVAGGTATVSQALLNALFGEQAVRELAASAREKLATRVGTLLEEDANRFRRQLWGQAAQPERSEVLREALAGMEEALAAS